MQATTLDEWHRIPKIGLHSGQIGAPTSNLWEWTHSLNNPRILREQGYSRALQPEHKQDSMGENDKLELQQSLQLSRPLARRSLWNVRETLPK